MLSANEGGAEVLGDIEWLSCSTALSIVAVSTSISISTLDPEGSVCASVVIVNSFADDVCPGGAGRTGASTGRSSDDTDFDVFKSDNTFDSNLRGFGGGRCVLDGGNGGGAFFIGIAEAKTEVGRSGGGGGMPCFDRAGGIGGGAGCFAFAVDDDFTEGRFAAGGRGGGGGGALGECDIDFLLIELSEALALSALSTVPSSELLRGLFLGSGVGVKGDSDSSRFGDFLEGEFSTKIASPSSTESKLSCGGDVGLSKVIDPKSPLFTMDGD